MCACVRVCVRVRIPVYIYDVPSSLPHSDRQYIDRRITPINVRVPALLFGDPHIITIDGFQYTFNGLGEFWLIRSSDFQLQGRTTKAKNDQGVVNDDGVMITNIYGYYFCDHQMDCLRIIIGAVNAFSCMTVNLGGFTSPFIFILLFPS